MNILRSIQNILSASDNITAAQLGTDGQAVVADAVQAAEALGGSGDQKFSSALAQAGSDLLTLGKDVSLFCLHLAIESAVTRLNAPAITAAMNASASAPEASAPASNAGAAPVVPQAQAPASAATIPASAQAAPIITGQALTNAIANVKAGSPLATEAANLVTELGGQGVTASLDQASAAINSGLAV